jgi:uncharacterized protein YggE
MEASMRVATAARQVVANSGPMARFGAHLVLFAAWLAVAAPAAQAQPLALPPARIIVSGEGSVDAAPDAAEIMSGVTVQAKTAREATDASSKAMAAIGAALRGAGVAQNDIQTARFLVSPVYGPQAAQTPPKRVGSSASNQIRITVPQIGRVGEILDVLISAGASEADSVRFVHSNLPQLLDQARQAAVADAKRKAELYATAAGLALGGVAWISEQPLAPTPLVEASSFAAPRPAVPISPGEDTLHARITVGFSVAH